jgi:hypothetical protein
MVSYVQYSGKFERKLTSIRIVSRMPFRNIHTENLHLKLCVLAVEYFRLGQGLRRHNQMPLMGQKSMDMTLCFDPESVDHSYLQMTGQQSLQCLGYFGMGSYQSLWSSPGSGVHIRSVQWLHCLSPTGSDPGNPGRRLSPG